MGRRGWGAAAARSPLTPRNSAQRGRRYVPAGCSLSPSPRSRSRPTATAAKLDCPGPPITTNGEVFNVGPRNTVVGLPGKVAMRRGNRWDTVDVGGRLTASVATADLEGDSCFDLVAGAPGRGRGGAVVVLRGARRTIDGTARVIRPKGVRPGDRFGAAVALSGSGGFQPTDLWVGAPGRDVRGHRDAGAVYRYRLHGKRRPELLGMYTAGMRAIRGARPEAGDMLGERLTAVSSGVIVGVPREDIGSAEDAGAVEFLRAKGRRMLRGQHFDSPAAGARPRRPAIGSAPPSPATATARGSALPARTSAASWTRA